MSEAKFKSVVRTLLAPQIEDIHCSFRRNQELSIRVFSFAPDPKSSAVITHGSRDWFHHHAWRVRINERSGPPLSPTGTGYW